MADDATMRQQVLAFIKKEYVEDEEEAEDLDESTKLMDSGLIDSFSITSIRDWLERTFSVKIPDELGTVANFQTVASIVALVKSRQAGA